MISFRVPHALVTWRVETFITNFQYYLKHLSPLKIVSDVRHVSRSPARLTQSSSTYLLADTKKSAVHFGIFWKNGKLRKNSALNIEEAEKNGTIENLSIPALLLEHTKMQNTEDGINCTRSSPSLSNAKYHDSPIKNALEAKTGT